jgi:hypothetical protein
MRLQGILEYVKIKWLLGALFVCAAFSLYHFVLAATITNYSDRLSTSAPGVSANHTINFITTTEIPPGGFIRFTPGDGDFDVPASPDFDIDNIALYVSSGGPYALRAATSSQTASEDGVVITTGNSGNIEITLNSTEGIPAGAQVRMLVGSHTPNATTTDIGITNTTATGTANYYIEAGDGVTNTRVRGKYAILEQVQIADVDTRETEPPFRYNGAPSGTISGTSLTVEISLETDEFAVCRYSTASGTPFFSMGNQFSSGYITVHSHVIPVATSTTYTFYVRCIDDEGNMNPDDYAITFTVPAFPTGVPGDDGEAEGEGSGTGTGSGDADPGDGDPSGGDDTSGGSSGGGGGGGGGGGSGASSGGDAGSGGFEGTDKPYQSGDGRVIITGYAFPRSTITVLVDGQIADTVTSGSDGAFSSTLDAIARGAYTFGVYGTDKNNVKSSTYSTTFTVTGARGSTLSNINVMPSIKVTPNPVDPGAVLTVSGYSIPNATITIENQNDKSSASLKTFTATSDNNGAWSVQIPTDGFNKGTYKVRAKAKQDAGISTNFSGYTFYGVGEAAKVARSSDLNRDGKVNLIDFSILLFWWNTAGGNSNPPADINGDGKVSLTDFSIMIFNWTG